MLKRFQVPKEIEVRVAVEDMRWTTEQLLVSVGMSETDAWQTADVLMYADLRGIDTHGVSNMLSSYLTQLADGNINPNPKWHKKRDHKATCVIDGDAGHGMVISPAAMNIAMERAGEHGIGTVSVMNCKHLGPCSYYAHMALDKNMLGQATTTGGLLMVPTYGKRPLLGLNAFAFAAPTRKNPPFVYDGSPSVVANNKLTLAKRLGQNVLPGWITDKDGNPIMEEASIPEKYMFLPLGSTREGGSQKGYALSVISEILTSILCASGGGPRRRAGSVHNFVAFDIACFSEPEDFMADFDQFLTDLLDCPTVSGEGKVLYSGYPEAQTEIDRKKNGIPYHPEVVKWFKGITAKKGVSWRLG